MVMASANVMNDALAGAALIGSGNRADIAKTTPFTGIIDTLQTHINFVSYVVDTHCPISTEAILILMPFIIGVARVVWPLLRASLAEARARRRKVVVRDIAAVSAAVYHSNGLPNDRNAFLQNAILMYLCKSVWTRRPIPASAWRNKTSVLLLIDPFRSRVYERSDSPFAISDSDSEDDDVRDIAFSGVAHSAKRLERLLLVKLPVGGSWVDVRDELGIEMTYKRQRVNFASTVAVERTISLRARGPDAAQRLEMFTQRSLSYFIAQLPKLNKSTRSYYELQPSKSVGLLNSSEDAKLTFKRYPLSDEKNLDTLFFPEREKTMRFIDDFLFHRGRFAVEGFPYKLGFLLHGPPGTGKTTFVKALAAYTGRHIVSVPLHAVETNQQLYDIFLNRTISCVGESEAQTIQLEDVIFLLDDVDAASPLVCARQRRRAIRRRPPARLTAKEQLSSVPGDAGARDEVNDINEDEEEELEEHIVELHAERKQGGGVGTAGLTPSASEGGVGGLDAFFLKSIIAAGGGGGGMMEGPESRNTAQTRLSQWNGSVADKLSGRASPATSNGVNGGAGSGSAAAAGRGTGAGFSAKKSLFSLFESADKLDLSGLLNVLDGVVDTPGRIVVMIANHPEWLDPALVRPGRMSTRLRFDYIRFDALARMAGLHFGHEEPAEEARDVVRIAEALEADIARDHAALRAAARHRLQQARVRNVLSAEDGDVDADDDAATTTRVAADGAALGKVVRGGGHEMEASNAGDANGISSAEEAVNAAESVEHRSIVVPAGVAAARVQHRSLSARQTQMLRDCVAALEVEAEEWKRAHCSSNGDGNGVSAREAGQIATAAASGGEDNGGTAAKITTATPTEGAAAAPIDSPFTFCISPSEVEMMCAQSDTLEEFMSMLSCVIRGELKL